MDRHNIPSLKIENGGNKMTKNESEIAALYIQIGMLQKQIEELEGRIEETYLRIDQLEENE